MESSEDGVGAFGTAGDNLDIGVVYLVEEGLDERDAVGGGDEDEGREVRGLSEGGEWVEEEGFTGEGSEDFVGAHAAGGACG